MICLNCGKETESCICEECKQKINLEELCDQIRAYTPEKNENPIWEKAALKMEQSDSFSNMALALADHLPSPRKEYQQILTIVGTKLRVPRANKPWFYEVYERIIGMKGLKQEEKLRIKGLMLETLYQDYRYPEANELASELLEEKPLPWQTIYFIAEFFSQTRRYDEADDAIDIGTALNTGNSDVLTKFADLSEKNEKRRTAADTGKKEYLPNPSENKAEAIEKYTAFMSSLGIDINASSTSFSSGGKVLKYPTPIPKGDYPTIVEKREADFDSFVAFDFETTGKYSGTDAIIEIGAIRVVNGQIVEATEFTFQEFVKPFRKGLPAEITDLTGITKDDLKDARQMWEVIPDFMRFVGDDILVGYNSIKFDAKFLCRAGRYCNEIYPNKHFDVLRYVKELKDTIHYNKANFELATVGEFLEIENPEAHRALADAITTAKIYLKLKEMSGGISTPASVDSVLDLEEW